MAEIIPFPTHRVRRSARQKQAYERSMHRHLGDATSYMRLAFYPLKATHKEHSFERLMRRIEQEKKKAVEEEHRKFWRAFFENKS